MRQTFIFNENEQSRNQYFTQAATWMNSMRNGVPLSSGEVLQNSLEEAEKRELENYIMELLMPEIEVEVKAKRVGCCFDHDKTEDFRVILATKVFEDFYKFNNVDYITNKSKRYTITTFIDRKAREAMRELMIEERGLPVNAIKNLRVISDAINDIMDEKQILEEMVSADMICEKLSHMSISKNMIITLMELYHGMPSIDAMDNFESRIKDTSDDFVDQILKEMSDDTKAAFDEVFLTFSKLELFIFMKEFGYFGEKIRKMTAKELSYQDYFIDMTKLDRDGEKNIAFGDIRIQRPGRNSNESNEILVESVHYVKERFYNNKFAKVKKKFATLEGKVPVDEIRAELKDYCLDLWERKFGDGI